ncbi:MAG: hypothetical protein IT223_07365 [Crocinitomicaceae bacterium]|nr:hypothetical protein [Crocinitomicaceae bacterium]
MNSSHKNILLICYDFPPNQGIGGRRWAKFAKELAERGYKVYVIKSEPIDGNIPSPWTDDTIHANIEVHSLPRKYPQVISHPGSSVWEKLTYRIYKWKLRRQEKGTIYDIAIGWEDVFQAKAREIISSHNIKNVIATGAPFNLLVYASRLKQLNPEINLIADYRDPWLGAVNMGMPQLSSKRRLVETEKERFVLSMADTVTFPYEHLMEDVRNGVSGGKNSSANFLTLSHFFDPADVKERAPVENEKITMVYGGEIYLGLEDHLKYFWQYLEGLKNTHPELYRKLEVKIFAPSSPSVYGWKNNEVVQWSKPIGKNIFYELRRAKICLLFLAKHNKNFRTTKFQEYLCFGKPFVHIGEQGAVAEFIREYKLGTVVTDYEKDLTPLLESLMKCPSSINLSEEFISRYSLPYITDQLERFFK